MEEPRVKERWIVLGGWAAAPEILRPVFGDEGIVYVDVNEAMPLLGGPDWPARAAEFLRERGAEGGAFRLAGWSTGAMVAASAAPLLGPRVLALFSSADSFCGGEGGWPARVVRRMRKRLAEDPAGVRAEFAERCRDPRDGPVDRTCFEKPYPADALGAGLDFLERYRREPAAGRAAYPILAFHGRDDKIVPSRAGRSAAESAGARFSEFEGGHLFFTDPGNAALLRGQL